MNITGETKILKDDRGVYKTTLSSKEVNTQTGEEETIFMKINVGFKRGTELKHKTKINIKDGFLTLFRIPTGNTYDDGKPEYKYFPKLIVMDFDIIEEGVDEVYTKKDYSNKQNNFSDDSMGNYYEYDNSELPF